MIFFLAFLFIYLFFVCLCVCRFRRRKDVFSAGERWLVRPRRKRRRSVSNRNLLNSSWPGREKGLGLFFYAGLCCGLFFSFFFFFFFTRRHRRVSVRVGFLFFDSRLAPGGLERERAREREREEKQMDDVGQQLTVKMSSFLSFFTSTFSHATNRWRREREEEVVEEEEEGDGENGGNRRIKEKGATAGHVSPGLPACLPHH